MSLSFESCDAIARPFENEVAHFLRGQGYRVHQRCLVPYFPGCANTTEVDVLAIKDGTIAVFECKAGGGVYNGEVGQETWTREYGTSIQYVHSPVLQAKSQAAAVSRNLKYAVHSVVVLADTVSSNLGTNSGVVHFADLEGYLKQLVEGDDCGYFALTDSVKVTLYDWEHPSDEVKAAHVTHVFRNKNKGVLKDFHEGNGVDMYCVSLQERYFYCFLDVQKRCWVTEELEEAALFATREEAESALYDCGIDGEVCTLRYGYVEFMSAVDIPEEMTPEEYAYEVGAYPYCM